MSRKATPVHLTNEDRRTLQSWERSGTTEQRLALRAKIVLLADQGIGTNAIAEEVGCMPNVVSKWRQRYAALGLSGLADAARSGKPRTYTEEHEQQVLRKLDEPLPEGYSSWSGPLLANALGFSEAYVWRVLRRHGIQLQRRRSWCLSTDPEFAPKAADIVGLYLDPPENAVVLCVDEKTGIQALERAQGWLKLPNGRALTGRTHEYKRHGTTTLFAALEVATGQVHGAHHKRRRRREFLDFMNEVVAQSARL